MPKIVPIAPSVDHLSSSMFCEASKGVQTVVKLPSSLTSSHCREGEVLLACLIRPPYHLLFKSTTYFLSFPFPPSSPSSNHSRRGRRPYRRSNRYDFRPLALLKKPPTGPGPACQKAGGTRPSGGLKLLDAENRTYCSVGRPPFQLYVL